MEYGIPYRQAYCKQVVVLPFCTAHECLQTFKLVIKNKITKLQPFSGKEVQFTFEGHTM